MATRVQYRIELFNPADPDRRGRPIGLGYDSWHAEQFAAAQRSARRECRNGSRDVRIMPVAEVVV